MEELRISITDKIRKAFTEKSSSLIFPWHPHGHMASVAGSHKDITDVRDGHTGGKDLSTFSK